MLQGHRGAITALACGPQTSPDPVLVSGSASVDGTIRVWPQDGALLVVLRQEGQSRDVTAVAVLNAGGPLGGVQVIPVTESGDPWRWRVQPTLQAALEEADFVTNSRLPGEFCLAYFSGLRVP